MKFTALIILTLFSFASIAQQVDSIQAPFKRYPTLPPLQLMVSDSTVKFTKNDLPRKKPVLIVLFNPDCEHCQHEAEELVKHKDDLKDIQVVMATTYSISKMNEFAKQFRLTEIPDLIIGKDIYYLLPPFFYLRNFPFNALYDKKGDLIDVFEGAYPVKTILEKFDK